MLGGGERVSNKVSEGGMNILQRCVIHFLHTHKKKQNMAKRPFLPSSPCRTGCPFRRFAPGALKSFWYPGGGYPFLTEALWWVFKILWRLRGEYAFFTGIFPEKQHFPKQEILNSSQAAILDAILNNTICSRVQCKHLENSSYSHFCFKKQHNG